ncbi:MAG: hypothetical protein KC477_06360 [Oceanospirillaceae bacterium]|nr:hypothetical protein [Oceanospirillaceae bacterium]
MHHSLHTHIAHAIRQDATYKLIDTLADAVFVTFCALKRGIKRVANRPVPSGLDNRQMG